MTGKSGQMQTDDNSKQGTTPWWHEQMAELSQEFQTHDIWYVSYYEGGGTWCSKPKNAPSATVNVASVGHVQAGGV
jgi:hypothetical protein